MIRINLLPFRAARKKENIRKQVSVFFLCLLLVLIVLGWVHFYLGSKQARLSANVADTKKELALYQEKNKEIRELRKKLQDLEMRQNVIQDLEKKRFEPVHILDELSAKIVAERMWLTSLNISGGKMDLDGIAIDNRTVADFIDNLEKFPELEDRKIPMYETIRLKRLQLQRIRNLGMKKFEISAINSATGAKASTDKK